MSNNLSVVFIGSNEISCPLTSHHIKRRILAETNYSFDRDAIRKRVESVSKLIYLGERKYSVNVIEVYTANRYFAAIELGDSRSIVFDYGFVELLADNIALEYLDFRTSQAMHEWVAAGRPQDWNNKNSPNAVWVGEKKFDVTGSMILRDTACKYLTDLIPESVRRSKLESALQWLTDDNRQASETYVSYLIASDQDLAMPFGQRPHIKSSFIDQLSLATTFIACHEIAHLIYNKADQAALLESRLFSTVPGIIQELERCSIQDAEISYCLGDITAITKSMPDKWDGIVREALVDVRAIEMLIQSERAQNPQLETWSSIFANMFGLISMANSLGIFRRHIASVILSRSMDASDINFARSEAVARNLFVLAYLLSRAQDLAGPGAASDLIKMVYFDAITLERRMIYFQLDLLSAVDEDGWKDLIDSVLA